MNPRKKRTPKHAGLPFALPVKKRGEDKKKLEKELDVLFSEYIRRRDKRCQFCMKVTEHGKLYCHHIWTRTSRAGRWNELNGVALCLRCHLHVAHRMYEVFRRWLIARVGQEPFDRLMALCNTRIKFTVADLQMLKADLKRKIEKVGKG